MGLLGLFGPVPGRVGCWTFGDWQAEAVPLRGEVSLVTTDGNFSAWEWIPLLLLAGMGSIERLALATFNAGPTVIDALEGLLANERIGVADLVLSDYWERVDENREIYARLRRMREDWPDRFRWATADLHAKAIAAWMSGGDTIVITGSGNLSTRNTRYEIYTVLNDATAARHVARWIGGIMR